MKLDISAARLVRLLLWIVAGLHVLSLIANYAQRGLGLRNPFPRFGWLVSFLNVDAEHNLPTWFASAVLLLTAYVLWEVGATAKATGARYAMHWKILCLVFVFLSIDEGAQVHEVANGAGIVHLGRASYLSWIAVAAPFVLVFAFSYLWLLAYLPAKVRWLIVAGGVLFVGGAVGLEIVGGIIGTTHFADGRDGFRTMEYSLFADAEELMEICGNITFLYAVASYLQQHLRAPSATAPTAPAAPVQEVPKRVASPRKRSGVHAG